MKLNPLLSITSVYMALLGLGFLFAPDVVGLGVVPSDASAGLIAYLRIPASLFLSIAVLNWKARNAEASTARSAIVLANIVGFGLAAVLEVLSVFSGNRSFALVFAAIHIFFAISLLWSGRTISPTAARR